MDWARMLAYVTGTVDQELLARNEYLAAENRIMKAQLNGRLKLSDAERGALGEIGHRLGRKVLADVATVARPETIQRGCSTVRLARARRRFRRALLSTWLRCRP
jgi:putative transposase